MLSQVQEARADLQMLREQSALLTAKIAKMRVDEQNLKEAMARLSQPDSGLAAAATAPSTPPAPLSSSAQAALPLLSTPQGIKVKSRTVFRQAARAAGWGWGFALVAPRGAGATLASHHE